MRILGAASSLGLLLLAALPGGSLAFLTQVPKLQTAAAPAPVTATVTTLASSVSPSRGGAYAWHEYAANDPYRRRTLEGTDRGNYYYTRDRLGDTMQPYDYYARSGLAPYRGSGYYGGSDYDYGYYGPYAGSGMRRYGYGNYDYGYSPYRSGSYFPRWNAGRYPPSDSSFGSDIYGYNSGYAYDYYPTRSRYGYDYARNYYDDGYGYGSSYGYGRGYGTGRGYGYGRYGLSPRSPAAQVMERAAKVPVQGESLRTWSFRSPAVERIHLALRTEGRPLDAEVSLWQGPDNTPVKVRVYAEDGADRPFCGVLETPRGHSTVTVKNKGQLEFPLAAHVLAETPRATGLLPSVAANSMRFPPVTIQGGSLRTVPFDAAVESVAVMLRTDGRPLDARIELLQGPNNSKQVVEVYSEDGLDRPFFMVLETPGDGHVVRVTNRATLEFPLTAWVEPLRMYGGMYRDGDAEGYLGGSRW